MNAEFKLFCKTLRTNGHFITKPRRQLFSALQNHSSLSITELLKQLTQQDQASVYRNIKLFEKLGIITRLRLGWNSKLELTDTFHHHHHHLTCLRCGKSTILTEDAQLESIIQSLSEKNSFTSSDHQLEIRGVCRNCK